MKTISLTSGAETVIICYILYDIWILCPIFNLHYVLFSSIRILFITDLYSLSCLGMPTEVSVFLLPMYQWSMYYDHFPVSYGRNSSLTPWALTLLPTQFLIGQYHEMSNSSANYDMALKMLHHKLIHETIFHEQYPWQLEQKGSSYAIVRYIATMSYIFLTK